MKTFQQIFMAVYMLGTLWLVISGIAALFKRRCVFWIGDKVFDWAGRKAILGGLLLVLFGAGMFCYAAYFVFRGADG
jgi:hypothetical protein